MSNYNHSPDCGEADTAWLAAADRAARRAAGVREPSLDSDRRLALMEELAAARHAEYRAGLDGPAALAAAKLATAAAAGRLDEDRQVAGRQFLRALADAAAVAPDELADRLVAALSGHPGVAAVAGSLEGVFARLANAEAVLAGGHQ